MTHENDPHVKYATVWIISDTCCITFHWLHSIGLRSLFIASIYHFGKNVQSFSHRCISGRIVSALHNLHLFVKNTHPRSAAVSRDPEKTAPIHQAQTCISPWSNFELPGAQDLAEVGFLGEKNAQSRLLILPTFWLFNFQRVAVEVGGAEGRWGGRTSRSVYTQPLTRRLRLQSLLIQTFVWLQVSVVDTAVKYDALE